MNSTQKLMDIKLRFFFKWKFILFISEPFLFCRYFVHVVTQSNEYDKINQQKRILLYKMCDIWKTLLYTENH